MPEDRGFYGYRLRSAVPLTGLPLLVHSDAEPDIVLRSGQVPAVLARSRWASPFVEVADDDKVLVKAGGGLRFMVQRGREITLDAPSGSAEGDIEAFLLSAVAGVLIHQRGDLALHASGVAIDNRAVAITGQSGRGKSTLAAALVADGHTLITDDVCRIRFVADRALVTPGPSRFRLWPDAMRALGRRADALESGRPGHPKGVMAADRSSGAAEVPLGAIVRLRIDSRLTQARIERLRGPAAVMPADELVYRVRLGRRLGRGVDLFHHLTRLARLVPVFALTRGEQPIDLSRLVALITSVSGRS